jgi:hypothetical protein
MNTRSRLLRGSAAIALAVGLLSMTAVAPAYAKPKDPESNQPSVPGGAPGLPGLPDLPGIGGGGQGLSPQDMGNMIAGGLRLAADAAEVVVPVVIEQFAGP